MKDDTSTPITDSGASPNEFESDKPGTSARTLSEGGIETLRAAGGVFVNAVRATRMPMVLTDPTLPGNPIVFANAAFLKMSGYSMEEVLGQQPHFMDGPDTDPRDEARFREMVRSDQDEILETIQYGKNGRRFVATVLISAFKDDAGRTLHHFMSWLDVTRRVEAEDEVADLRGVQSALSEELRNTLLLHDLGGRLVSEDSVQTIYEGLLSAAIEITGADAGTVQALDIEAQELLIIATRGFSQKTTDYFDRVDARSETSCGIALRLGDRAYLNFDPASTDPSACMHIDDGILSAQSTPLITRSGQPIGMVSTHWAEADHRPSERQLRFLDLLARQAADLLEQRLAAHALRESEEKYRTLFESMSQGYAEMEIIRDADGRAVDLRWIELNPTYERLTGMSVAECLGRTVFEVIPDFDPWWVAEYDRIVRGGQPERVEYVVKPLDRWFEAHVYPQSGDRFTVLYEDITDRKLAETTLRESEKRKAFLLRLSDALRAEPNADAVAMRAISMLADQLQLDRSYITLYRPEDDEADFPYQVGNESVPPLPAKVRLSDFPDAYRQVLDKTYVIEDDFERRGLSKAERANSTALGMRAMLASTVRRGERNPLCSLVGVSSKPRSWTPSEVALVEDAAERTWAAMERSRAEAALRESEQRYRTLFETMDEGFVVNELIRDDAGNPIDLRYLELNPAVERLVGWNAKETVGRLMSEMLTAEETKQWVDDVASVIASGQSLQSEHNHDSLGMWFRANLTPIGGDRVALVYQNITDQKRAELTLRASEERKAFLLKLSDAVRPIANPADIQGETTRLLREQLNAGWCYYVDWDLDKKTGLVLRDSTREGLPSLAGEHDVSDVPEFLQLLAEGAVLTVPDYASYEKLSTRIRQNFTALGFRSMMAAPLVKEGRLIASLLVGDTETRDWSANDESLLVEVAERTWAAVGRARAEAALRESEARYRRLFDSIDEGFVVVELVRAADGRAIDYRIVEINPAFERQSGLLDAKGKLRSELAPGNEDAWLDVYDEVARTGETRRLEDYHEPTDRWYDVFVAPIEKTEPPRLSIVFADITHRKRADAALRESEKKYRNLYTEMGQGYIEVELIRGPGGDAIDYRYLSLNPAYERLTGIPIDKAVGRPSLEVIPDLSPFWAETFQRIVDNQTAEEFEYEEKALDRWYGIYAYPGDGDRLTVLALDITQRKKAEAALRESEARLAAAFESVPAGLSALDLNGRSIIANAEYRRFLPTGIIPSRDPAGVNRWKGWDEDGELLDPQNWPSARALRGESVVPGQEMLYTDDEGRTIWTNVATAPTFDESGNVTGVVSVISDIDERKQAEEALKASERHAQILLGELQHRVRNTLAVVRSIARRTADRSETLDEMVSHFEGRLNAFSRVQSAVTRNPEAGLSLDAIVEDELISIAAREGEQFRISGPEVSLRARPAESISLAIHELATNAVKYGALTSKDGRIKVSWDVRQADAGRQELWLEWVESGLGRKPAESHEGFGHEMLRRSLPYDLGAETDIRFTDDGMRFTMVMPLGPEVLTKGRA